jgi:hypothetical protein
MGANTHVAVTKFGAFFDVEVRKAEVRGLCIIVFFLSQKLPPRRAFSAPVYLAYFSSLSSPSFLYF